MKPRCGGGVVYFLVIAMTLVVRISQYVGIDDALGIDIGTIFTLSVQIGCFGLLPVLGWWIIVGGARKDTLRTLPRTFGIVKCSKRDLGRVLVITLPALLLTGLAANAWYNFLSLTGFDTGGSSSTVQTVPALISDIVLSAVLPAVFEELVHRGELIATYRDSGGKAVLVSALLFALMHQNILQLAHTFLLGAVLAAVVWCSGSVLPAMLVHFFNNFVSVISGYDGLVPVFGVIGDATSWLYGTVPGMAVLCVLAVASALLIAVVLRRMRYDAVREGRLPAAPFFSAAEGALPLHRDVLLWTVTGIGVAAMLFSLSWGYL